MSKNVLIHNVDNLPTCDFSKFVELQGNLKNLSAENYQKLKDSIMTYGFSFAVPVWENDGILYIIDGHQRKRVLQKMREDGYDIPPVPFMRIYARDKKEAIEKLLMFNSRYGSRCQ